MKKTYLNRQIELLNHHFIFKSTNENLRFKFWLVSNIITIIVFFLDKELRYIAIVCQLAYLISTKYFSKQPTEHPIRNRLILRVLDSLIINIHFHLLAVWIWSYFYGWKFAFLMATLCLNVCIWFCWYYYGKSAIAKQLKNKKSKLDTRRIIIPGVGGIFGLIGVILGRKTLSNLNDETATYIAVFSLLFLAHLFAFGGLDIAQLELLYKDSTLEQKCREARENPQKKQEPEQTKKRRPRKTTTKKATIETGETTANKVTAKKATTKKSTTKKTTTKKPIENSEQIDPKPSEGKTKSGE